MNKSQFLLKSFDFSMLNRVISTKFHNVIKIFDEMVSKIKKKHTQNIESN